PSRHPSRNSSRTSSRPLTSHHLRREGRQGGLEDVRGDRPDAAGVGRADPDRETARGRPHEALPAEGVGDGEQDEADASLPGRGAEEVGAAEHAVADLLDAPADVGEGAARCHPELTDGPAPDEGLLLVVDLDRVAPPGTGEEHDRETACDTDDGARAEELASAETGREGEGVRVHWTAFQEMGLPKRRVQTTTVARGTRKSQRTTQWKRRRRRSMHHHAAKASPPEVISRDTASGPRP